MDNLIDGCRKNDPQSQENLYKQFYPAMFALCKCFFSDNHDILTAVNNGMLKVFRNIHQYDPGKGDFFNWAYTIVRNAALTLIRDKKSKLSFELNENTSDAVVDNPFQQFEWKDIYYYLDQLPTNTRYVCSLYYLEGFSIKEIVELIDMKEGTVKWHLNECRTRLRVIFDKHNVRNIG